MTNQEKQEDFVISTGKLSSLSEFVDCAFSTFDLNWKNHVSSDRSLFRESDINKSYGDPTQMEKDLNWKAKINLDQIIDRLIENQLT